MVHFTAKKLFWYNYHYCVFPYIENLDRWLMAKSDCFPGSFRTINTLDVRRVFRSLHSPTQRNGSELKFWFFSFKINLPSNIRRCISNDTNFLSMSFQNSWWDIDWWIRPYRFCWNIHVSTNNGKICLFHEFNQIGWPIIEFMVTNGLKWWLRRMD